MSHLNGKSLNIKDKNIEKLVKLFPEVNTDGKIDFEKLKQILGDYVDDSEERYRFVWNGKGESLRLSQTPSMGTLRPAKEEGESKNWDETENLYIEGDNLEVLKLLQKSYFNKVKMIYIDPPYNTGGDFVYKDNFNDNIQNYKKITGQVDSEGNATTTNREYSGRYHTDWLNMMYPRLRLAKNLLTVDGVIFISIDDNEVHNLTKITDEIFGEENFIGQLTVNSTPNGRDYGHIAKMHEYILMYGKDVERTYTNKLKDEDRVFKYKDSISEFNIHPLYNSNESFTSDNRPNLYYSFYLYPDRRIDENFFEIGFTKRDGAIEIFPPKSLKNNVQFVWRWGKEKSLKNLNKEIIGYKVNDEYRIVQKMRGTDKLLRSILSEKEFSSRRGTAEVEELFNNKIFSFPKPLKLLKTLLEIGLRKDDLVLDLFSGSSTTAHAVMDLNAEDNGDRKYIMVQLPEATDKKSEAYKAGYENIAEIAKERIRRAGEKVKTELKEKYEAASEEERKEMKHPDELDIGFKVFKLDSSNIKEWNPGKYENVQQAIEDALTPYVQGRAEEDVVYEMMLKMGLDLTYPVEEIDVNGKTIYSIGYGFLMICLADKVDIVVAEKMIEIKDENNQQEFRAIFRDEGFSSDTDKTNVKETLRSAELAEESFITL